MRRKALRKVDSQSFCPVIRSERLGKVYGNGTRALQDVSLSFGRDDFVAIIGSSGAGKSTFLRCLNRLVRPSAGSVELLGEDITCACGRHLNQVRRRVGIIFQQFHLVRRLTVLDNVMVGRLRFNASPLRQGLSLMRLFTKSEKEIAFDCLKQVGIAELAFQRADTLSGGQQQRVAIARTLAQKPEVFLADEPIASLDPRSAETVMEILRQIHESKQIPVIVNLHHIEFAQRYAKRVVGMAGGRVVFDGNNSDLTREVIMPIYGAQSEEQIAAVSACA